jgi:hypothetical protein
MNQIEFCLALVEHMHGFHNRVAHDLKALGAEFVHGILRGVMEDVVVTIIQVNYIGARNSVLDEGQVVVLNGALPGVEMGLIACALGGNVDQVE